LLPQVPNKVYPFGGIPFLLAKIFTISSVVVELLTSIFSEDPS